MKVLVLIACILSTAAAFGQTSAAASVLNNQPIILQVPSHPQHASSRPMADQQCLLGQGGYTIAQGERPLWEVAPQIIERPLGDTARDLKNQRLMAKKAKFVVEN